MAVLLFAHDEIELVVKRILRLSASDVAELDIKFAALWFTLYDDRPDWPEARRLASFGGSCAGSR